MTTYDDNLLAARFTALAPEPLPADWSDVVGRARALARPPRPTRRRLVIAFAVATALVALTAAAFGAVRYLVLDKGFVGLPPEGATPSAPESGELVLSVVGRGTADHRLARAWLYADGRLIWGQHGDLPEGANPAVTGLLEQRLTSDGVERLRSEVVSTGLFDHDQSLVSARLVWGAVTARVSGRLVRVEWGHDVSDSSSDGTSWTRATPEQEQALERLDALLPHPGRVLPENAWADKQLQGYVPSMFAVCWTGWPAEVSDPQSDPSRILSLLPPAAGELLRAKETRRRTGQRGWAGGPFFPSAEDCATVTTAEARSLAGTLDDAGIERTDPGYGLEYTFGVPESRGEKGMVTFEPLLPDGEWTNFRSG